MSYSSWIGENEDTVKGAVNRMPQAQNQSASVVQQAPSQVAEQQPAPGAVQPQAKDSEVIPAMQQKDSEQKPGQAAGQKPTMGQQFQKYSSIIQNVAGPSVHSTSGASPSTLRESAFRSGPKTQSDAPQISRPGPTGGRINKIMEVVGTIFSMGASQAGSDKYSSRNGGNAGEGAGSSVVGQ